LACSRFDFRPSPVLDALRGPFHPYDAVIKRRCPERATMQRMQSGKAGDGSGWRWFVLAVLIALVVFITAPPLAAASMTVQVHVGAART
jgi:hypothetical protein